MHLACPDAAGLSWRFWKWLLGSAVTLCPSQWGWTCKLGRGRGQLLMQVKTRHEVNAPPFLDMFSYDWPGFGLKFLYFTFLLKFCQRIRTPSSYLEAILSSCLLGVLDEAVVEGDSCSSRSSLSWLVDSVLEAQLGSMLRRVFFPSWWPYLPRTVTYPAEGLKAKQLVWVPSVTHWFAGRVKQSKYFLIFPRLSRWLLSSFIDWAFETEWCRGDRYLGN